MISVQQSQGLAQKRSVLIVDPSEESCEVLQTALLRRGVRAYAARHAIEGVNLVKQHHPDLIILDLDIDNNRQPNANPSFWASWGNMNIPLIILGTIRRHVPYIPRSEFVSKPYHYGPLIRRIEEMLSTTPRDVALQG